MDEPCTHFNVIEKNVKIFVHYWRIRYEYIILKQTWGGHQLSLKTQGQISKNWCVKKYCSYDTAFLICQFLAL